MELQIQRDLRISIGQRLKPLQAHMRTTRVGEAIACCSSVCSGAPFLIEEAIGERTKCLNGAHSRNEGGRSHYDGSADAFLVAIVGVCTPRWRQPQF